MSETFQTLSAEAMKLSQKERVALAGMLLESADAEVDEATVTIAWEKEIADRIRAVHEGRIVGLCYEEVMRPVDRALKA